MRNIIKENAMSIQIMYQFIVLSTVGFLAVATCAAIFIDWDKIGYKYFPDTFAKPKDK